MPPAFVVTPMHADDGDEDGEEGGNFFDFKSFENVENEASPFDDIAPDVATFGSVEDNLNVLRESIGIPDEVVDEVNEEDNHLPPQAGPILALAAKTALQDMLIGQARAVDVVIEVVNLLAMCSMLRSMKGMYSRSIAPMTRMLEAWEGKTWQQMRLDH